MTIRIRELRLYPIKSTGGYNVDEIACGPNGLDGDRRFLIINAKGKFITARERPQLVNLASRWTGDETIELSAYGKNLSLKVPNNEQPLTEVGVWADHVESADMGETAADWISDYLGEAARVVAVSKLSQRLSQQNKHAPSSYADAYPILTLSDASVTEINSHLDAATFGPVTAVNFRPNIILEGVENGFDEDLWQTIKIGDVIIDQIMGCSRCVLTTVDPDTGIKRKDGQPMKALSKFRRGDDKQIYVGQNGVPRGSGVIRVGDAVEIIQHRGRNVFANDAKFT